MRKNSVVLLISILLPLLFISCDREQRLIKIMPVGNSITAGEHYHLPPMEERTGYRKMLYEKLDSAGFNVDFVGSTGHGKREQGADWYDWNSESYPGWKINDIADTVLKTLPLFQPDILLVHVGTNGKEWDIKPAQLMDFLDGVDSFGADNGKKITVLLALIMNFFEASSADVPVFNSTIKEMIPARQDKYIRIVLVDMEHGAGIDYSDHLPDPASAYNGGDMWGRQHPDIPYDFAHPNDRGYRKMADQWFKVLVPVLEDMK